MLWCGEGEVGSRELRGREKQVPRFARDDMFFGWDLKL